MVIHGQYINGELVPASAEESSLLYSPFDNSIIGAYAIGSAVDVENASKAAAAAFPVWKLLGMNSRLFYLEQFYEILRKNIEKIIELEALNIGILRKYARQNIEEALANFKNYLHLAGTYNFSYSEANSNTDETVLSSVVEVPYGVCGLIIPWNYPFFIGINKLVPALLAGNTVVLKPSPVAPCSWLFTGELLYEMEFPKGVVNIVNISDAAAAELTANQAIDLISFTGSLATARKIYKNPCGNLKKFILECGGNSAHIIYKKNNLEDVIIQIMTGFIIHAGQVCVAGRRLLIQDVSYDEFIKKLQFRMRFIKYLTNIDEETNYFPVEPVISRQQLEKIDHHVKLALQEGGELLCGGKIKEPANGGFYYEPTVITGNARNMKSNSIEIFGPVLLVYKITTLDEASDIVNDSPYGLSATIWSDDEATIDETVIKLDTGSLFINTTPFESHNDNAPFSGTKCSGIGCEGGRYGFKEFLRYKHIIKKI